jgi:regulator of RNase E activity RraB
VRDVHHWIYFRTAGDRSVYASSAKDLGYVVEREIDGKETQYPYGIIIARDQAVTPSLIDDAVLELFDLAQQVLADYDGWEARVVSTRN